MTVSCCSRRVIIWIYRHPILSYNVKTSSAYGPILLKWIRVVRMTCHGGVIRVARMTWSGEVIHWIGMDLFRWYSQLRQRPHPVRVNSCGPNGVFRWHSQFRQRPHPVKMNPYTRNGVSLRGYPLDWDGPMSLGSVNSGPVPTGRALTHETSII